MPRVVSEMYVRDMKKDADRLISSDYQFIWSMMDKDRECDDASMFEQDRSSFFFFLSPARMLTRDSIAQSDRTPSPERLESDHTLWICHDLREKVRMSGIG